MNKKLLLSFVFGFLLLLVSAVDEIDFQLPTLADKAILTDDFVEINISISDPTLNTVIYNWNGTNFTIYDKDLIAYFNFDNNSAIGDNTTHAVDISKGHNQHNLSYYGLGGGLNCIYNYGKYSGGIASRSSDCYLTTKGNEGLEITATQPITIALWANTYDTVGDEIAVSLGTQTASHDALEIGVSGNSWFYRIDRTPYTAPAGIGDATVNVSAFLTAVYNTTDVLFYINGTFVQKTTDDIADASIADIFILAGYGTGNRYNGWIDNLMIWNRSLSQNEITQLYMTNLKKVDTTLWNLYVNQSANVTEGLTRGDYTYYAWANDTSSNSNMTEIRNLYTSSINVTLDSPTNNAVTSKDTLYFNVTITPTNANLTNATLYVWYANSTLWETDLTTFPVGTNTTQTVNFTLSDWSTMNQSYMWNVESWGYETEDETRLRSGTANNNFTLLWAIFEISDEHHNSDVLETQNQTFLLNITTDEEITKMGAFLNYNGTRYAAEHSCSAGLCQLEREIDIPLIANQAAGSQNTSFYWSITLFGGFGTANKNSSAYQQNISNIDFTTIDTGGNIRAVEYKIYNETSVTLINLDSFDATFDYYLGTGTVIESKNYSLSGNHSYNFYINHNETFITSPTIHILNNTNFTGIAERNYFFMREEYTYNTIVENLSLPGREYSEVIIEVKDQGLTPLEGYLVKIYRFYPGLNQHRLVESQLTDEFGQFVAKIVETDARYKFEFYDSDKVLRKTSEKITIACRSSFCIVPFVIEVTEDYYERYQNLTLFSYDFSFDNETNTFLFAWDDQRDENSRVRLEVIRSRFNESVTVCDKTSTAKVSSLDCVVGNMQANYKAQIFRQIGDGYERRLAVLHVSVGSLWEDIGKEGLLWVFILLFTAIGVGAFNPSIGAALYGAGFIIMGIVGLISMPLPVFFANTLLVIIFIWAVRT